MCPYYNTCLQSRKSLRSNYLPCRPLDFIALGFDNVPRLVFSPRAAGCFPVFIVLGFDSVPRPRICTDPGAGGIAPALEVLLPVDPLPVKPVRPLLPVLFGPIPALLAIAQSSTVIGFTNRLCPAPNTAITSALYDPAANATVCGTAPRYIVCGPVPDT
jgi:hypothetical protein